MQHASVDLLLSLNRWFLELLHSFNQFRYLNVYLFRISREDSLEVFICCVINIIWALCRTHYRGKEFCKFDDNFHNLFISFLSNLGILLVDWILKMLNSDYHFFLAEMWSFKYLTFKTFKIFISYIWVLLSVLVDWIDDVILHIFQQSPDEWCSDILYSSLQPLVIM